MQKSTFIFNRELLLGECGALVFANPAASVVSRFTKNPDFISYAAVGGTLLGGAVFWLIARIYDSTRNKRLDTKVLASDIGYFTPAAIVLGFLVYDPTIYFTTHHLLKDGNRVVPSVLLGQAFAFVMFVLCMNLYRILLAKLRGKTL
jgi:hypothetical protein